MFDTCRLRYYDKMQTMGYVSETALPKDEESVLKTPASKTEPVRTERTGSRSSGLVFLALLLGIDGI
ncbi:heme biosynthesis operon protein HemX, partial [Pseudomonas syringae pv. tagetis]